jgi:hypothetical protein
MNRLPDLPLGVQTALIFATLIAAASVMARGMIAIGRNWLAVPHQYPTGWSHKHIDLLEQFRLLTGIALSFTWVVLFAVSPVIPSSAPFGLLPALLSIVLLLVTSAWLHLSIPGSWQRTFIGKLRFEHALGCLVLLWVGLIAGALFAIARSANFPEAGTVHLIGKFA